MNLRRSRANAGLLVLLAIRTYFDSPTSDAEELPVIHRRHPVAIAILGDDERFVTANRQSGTISVVELRDGNRAREYSLGRQLSDVVAIPGESKLLATDEQSHELIALQLTPTDCQIQQRLSVSPYPVSVRVSHDARRAFVMSLWSRTVSVVELDRWLLGGESSTASLLHKIELPFCPREALIIEDARQAPAHPCRLLVADAFGAQLAVIDPDKRAVESIREIPGHAIRGLQRHPRQPRVLMTHQQLSRLATTKFEDVHWGNLMANCLRSIDLQDLLDPNHDLLNNSIVHYLGEAEHGAGDPAGLLIVPEGQIAVALSGTDELICDDGRGRFSQRIPVGTHPTAIVGNSNRSTLYIVNSLSDSVTVVDWDSRRVMTTISLGPTRDRTSAERGEVLFHSAMLSHDRWMSCASCHVAGHTNGQLNDNLTDSSFGTPKRILSLRGVVDSAPYAWNGRFATLAEQVQHSVTSTMQGDPLDDTRVNDLVAFLQTLPPAVAIGSTNAAARQRGADLFQKLDCHRCHVPETFTSTRIADVGLKDERGISEFNPPSLRGVSQNGPYFHDGRARTLESVFRDHHHQSPRDLSMDELRDLLEYLNDL